MAAQNKEKARTHKKFLGVDANIALLGLVSFLTDVSSEMIFSVFSVFFTVILGASVVLLGIIEGLADFSSASLDYVSGYLSDKTGKRKLFALAGYGFSTLSKAILIVSSTATASAVFRVTERFGKSFRGPPRDAWISDLSTDSNRGYAFGLHKAFDKAGAILGPLIAYFILSYAGESLDSFKLLFMIAFVPALLAVILMLFIKDKPMAPKKTARPFVLPKFGDDLKHYLYTAGIFSLAYFSFGFLLLKAYLVGFGIKDIILLYALFNVSFVIIAVPIGRLGDIIGRKKIIALGYALYFIMSLGFMLASSKLEVVALFLVFGAFYAIDESQSKAYITDLEKNQKATIIGFYNFITGLIYVLASLIAGYLWKISPNYAFAFAAAVSLFTLLFFLSKRSASGKSAVQN